MARPVVDVVAMAVVMAAAMGVDIAAAASVAMHQPVSSRQSEAKVANDLHRDAVAIAVLMAVVMLAATVVVMAAQIPHPDQARANPTRCAPVWT